MLPHLPAKKAKVQWSTTKVTLPVFLDNKSVILRNTVSYKKDQQKHGVLLELVTFISECYRWKRHGLLSKGMLLLTNSALACWTADFCVQFLCAIAAMNPLTHLQYSSHLTFPDFFLSFQIWGNIHGEKVSKMMMRSWLLWWVALFPNLWTMVLKVCSTAVRSVWPYEVDRDRRLTAQSYACLIRNKSHYSQWHSQASLHGLQFQFPNAFRSLALLDHGKTKNFWLPLVE